MQRLEHRGTWACLWGGSHLNAVSLLWLPCVSDQCGGQESIYALDR